MEILSRRFVVYVAVLFGVALWVRPGGDALHAQDVDQLQFGDRVDVALVNVEVWVTDRKGNPVTGLLADDFEVWEDGEPVEITHFAEYSADSELLGFDLPDTAEEATVPAAAPEPSTAAEADEVAGRPEGHLVLYFDETRSGPVGRPRLIKDLRAFFKSSAVPPENVLVLRQGESGLAVEANLGSTRKDLKEAFDRLEDTTTEGRQSWADDVQAIRRMQDLWEQESLAAAAGPGADPCDFFVSKAFREIQFYIQHSSERIRDTLDSLRAASTFLAGIPGPKTLVYVSDGLTMTPGANLRSFVQTVCPGRDPNTRLDLQDGLHPEFRDMTRHAAANRITFYPLHTLGNRTATGLSGADQRSLRNTSTAIARYDSESRIYRREGLSLLASETGGRAILGKNRFLEDLERVADDMKGYYSLAYEPRHGGDGLEHKIRVEVRGDRGVEVRHRPGYRDKSAEERLTEKLESTLYLNLMANPLAVRLGVGTIREGDDKEYVVPFHVRVPADRLTFLPGREGDAARLRVQILAQNERRKRTASVTRFFDVSRPADGEDVIVQLPLELKEGIHVVAVGIRDEVSLQTSYVSTGMELQPPSGP